MLQAIRGLGFRVCVNIPNKSTEDPLVRVRRLVYESI